MKKNILTKGELKERQNNLGRYHRFLPMLQLKKRQLQFELHRIREDIRKKKEACDLILKEMEPWSGVFAEEADLEEKLTIGKVQTRSGNIAGIEIPLFVHLPLDIADYDLISTPLWVDAALEKLSDLYLQRAELKVCGRQEEVVLEELHVTSQRVNLFEKMIIPETQSAIRKIRNHLDDQQTLEVARSKEAKKRMHR